MRRSARTVRAALAGCGTVDGEALGNTLARAGINNARMAWTSDAVRLDNRAERPGGAARDI